MIRSRKMGNPCKGRPLVDHWASLSQPHPWVYTNLLCKCLSALFVGFRDLHTEVRNIIGIIGRKLCKLDGSVSCKRHVARAWESDPCSFKYGSLIH